MRWAAYVRRPMQANRDQWCGWLPGLGSCLYRVTTDRPAQATIDLSGSSAHDRVLLKIDVLSCRITGNDHLPRWETLAAVSAPAKLLML